MSKKNSCCLWQMKNMDIRLSKTKRIQWLHYDKKKNVKFAVKTRCLFFCFCFFVEKFNFSFCHLHDDPKKQFFSSFFLFFCCFDARLWDNQFFPFAWLLIDFPIINNHLKDWISFRFKFLKNWIENCQLPMANLAALDRHTHKRQLQAVRQENILLENEDYSKSLCWKISPIFSILSILTCLEINLSIHFDYEKRRIII